MHKCCTKRDSKNIIMVTVNIIRRSEPNKDGSHSLQLKVTKDRQTIRLNTGKTILPNEWNDTEKKVNTKHPNSRRLNNYLQEKKIEANKIILQLEEHSHHFTLSLVRARLIEAGIVKGRIKKSITPSTQIYKTTTKSTHHLKTVFECCDAYFLNLLEAKDFNRYSGERAAVNHLKRYRKNKDMLFEEMTVSFLQGYKAYLVGRVGVSVRSSVNYLITIRTIYNRAIADGLVSRDCYPFGKRGISCKRPESEKIGLDDWEVKLIESVELPKGSFLHHARNVWLFSFYFAGIRAGDVLRLQWKDIINGRLHYTMNKNNKTGSVKIPSKAQFILNEYRLKERLPHNLIFPDISNVFDFNDKIEVQKKLKYRIRKLNKALRKIAEITGITKDVTMHISRHSFGNIAGDKIPIQRLQQLYRHSSITTTINYQQTFLNKGADEALDTVLDF